MIVAGCSKSDDGYSLGEMQTKVYNDAFKEEFGTPAANHDWGFGSFQMVDATVTDGSWTVGGEAEARGLTRAVAETVNRVNAVKYNSREDLYASEADTAYFYLRIDNKIVLQELNGVSNNNENDYFPKEMTLATGARDGKYSTDNQGSINVAEWQKLGLIDDANGVTYASADQPIPDAVLKNAPSFETMAAHVPDDNKIRLAGSVEAFNSQNYKIFWYVVKWQASDKLIHVDGVLVPKTQITVNVPEYKKRIIVEDLKGNINATTKVKSSDFDFNDAVFDAVTWNINGKNHLKIILRAAGGEMPIYVAGKEIHDGIGYMFNTKDPDYEYGKVIVEDSIIGEAAETFDFNSIPVEVMVGKTRVAAGSNIGEAPEKIAVGLDYKWCKERENIKEVYTRFVDYVGNKSLTNWWK